MLRGNRKKMGKYGVDPNELAHILSINEYIDLLSDTAVFTLEKYGPNATILTGELAKVDNVPVIVSEAVRVRPERDRRRRRRHDEPHRGDHRLPARLRHRPAPRPDRRESSGSSTASTTRTR
jgi:hypothetical protein